LSRRPKKAAVDLDQITRLSDLSRLSLSPSEAQRMERELSSVLEYFAVIDKAEVGDVAPSTQRGEGRPDVVGPSPADEILAGVPQKKGRLVRAPKVF
jgi:aspartyl-tRNA(Asn)/glutamyl-tRNA(Gln) amidotransferase subunit C